ncbi:rhamnan synthesis F family protein [Agrococcus sp. SGAir0287]|uniref:rhamnan synthesis F family protein n=1 Tax=Agrococcus sp. SGAir0287 TaxID=2070347 RepID=UPI0010CCEAD7|nr:rhamnan synthesis F family protein [Agrococcus sp. SGAir0287]QCR20018.1 hypothetical protein C1N71_11700 [Agrococcus sp. SGAir0287]
MILGPDARRLGIYFLYDAEGVVDDATFLMLEAIHAHCHELIVVVNGFLDDAGRDRLETLPRTTVLQRANEGFDVWAYRTALRAKGWDELERFDEVVLCNFTILGPVHPLSEMFDEMAARDDDFWGLTTHNGATFDPFSTHSELGYLPVHLQSHFIAVRRSLATSPEFRDYWEHMVPIHSYADAVGKHEVVFTKRFAELGFRWTAYVDTSDTIGQQYYPLFNDPVRLLQEHRSPVFKRKSFFAGPAAYVDETSHDVARRLYDHLRDGTSYDHRALLRHLLRTCDVADLHATLALHEVVEPREPDRARRLRAYVSCAGMDAVRAVRAARAAGVDDVVVLCEHGCRGACDEASRVLLDGGDPLRTSLRDIREHPIDAACVLLGPSSGLSFPFSAAESTARQAIDDVLASREHVEGILRLLETDDTGLLVAAPPVHATWFGALGDGWRGSHDRIRAALAAIGRAVPTNERRDPISLASGALWLLPDAAEGLETLGVSAEDARTALPSIVASNGLLTRHVTTPQHASVALVTSLDYLRRLGSQVGSGGEERFSALLHRVRQMAEAGQPGHHARTIVAFSIAWDVGGSRVDAEHVAFVTDGAGTSRITLVPPPGAVSAHLDPVDGARVLCDVPRIRSRGALELRIDGAVEAGDDLLLDEDASLRVVGALVPGESFTIEFDRLRLDEEGPAILDALVDQRGSRP